MDYERWCKVNGRAVVNDPALWSRFVNEAEEGIDPIEASEEIMNRCLSAPSTGAFRLSAYETKEPDGSPIVDE